MRNHIKYLVLALLLLGCKNYKSLTTQIDKNKAIPYNQYSQEFQAWEATKNIKSYISGDKDTKLKLSKEINCCFLQKSKEINCRFL